VSQILLKVLFTIVVDNSTAVSFNKYQTNKFWLQVHFVVGTSYVWDICTSEPDRSLPVRRWFTLRTERFEWAEGVMLWTQRFFKVNFWIYIISKSKKWVKQLIIIYWNNSHQKKESEEILAHLKKLYKLSLMITWSSIYHDTLSIFSFILQLPTCLHLLDAVYRLDPVWQQCLILLVHMSWDLTCNNKHHHNESDSTVTYSWLTHGSVRHFCHWLTPEALTHHHVMSHHAYLSHDSYYDSCLMLFHYIKLSCTYDYALISNINVVHSFMIHAEGH